MIAEIFEIIMIVCFGFSWPMNVIKSYRARTTKGKSLPFLLLIITGYVFGIIGKLIGGNFKWYVLFFYVLNLAMVSVDLALYVRNYRLDKQNGLLLQKLEEVFPKPWKDSRKGTQLAPKVYLEPGEKFDWPDLNAPEEEGPYFCYGLRDQIGILWDGTVVPCCLDHEGDIPLGNILTQTMEEILESDRAKAIYDGFSKKEAAEPLCRRCGYARRFK